MKRKRIKSRTCFGATALTAALLLSTVASLAVSGRTVAAHPGNPQQNQGQQTRSQQGGGANSSRSTQASAGRTSTGALVSLEEDYRIGANDVIEVQIENAPELSRSFRVTAAGTFLMPYLGRIAALQKTPEELAEFITNGLRGDYLKDPKVTVVVKEYNSRSFFIQGAVRNPGVYQIEGRPSLLELITVASGLLDNHGATAFIIRKNKTQATAAPVEVSDKAEQVSAPADASAQAPSDETADGPRYDLRRVNINGLLKGRFDQDMYLEPGDIVNIPPTDVFFVAGEVNAPGSFPLKEGTTLRQAISLAQGTTFQAATNRGIIFRENPTTGKQQEMEVDISKVMSGKKEDITILANDVIIVPNSQLKSVGGALLRAFGLSTAGRVPVPR